MIKLPQNINTILLPPLSKNSGKSTVRYLPLPKIK